MIIEKTTVKDIPMLRKMLETVEAHIKRNAEDYKVSQRKELVEEATDLYMEKLKLCLRIGELEKKGK